MAACYGYDLGEDVSLCGRHLTKKNITVNSILILPFETVFATLCKTYTVAFRLKCVVVDIIRPPVPPCLEAYQN